MPNIKISTLSLNAVGTSDPLVEAVLLKSAASVFEELGIKKIRIRINSIGDKDSSVRFLREITQQIRKRASDLSKDELLLMRTNIATLITALYTNRHPVIADLPSPLDFLTTPSRRYFKDVLELLEHTNIPFELDDRLYADPKTYSHTVYEIFEEIDNKEMVLARGGRYDELTRSYVRSTVPSSGIVIAARTKDQRSTIARTRRKKPAACLIHIGREARIASIDLVETFRHENISIEQCLHLERFSDQMEYAETQNTKYIIIIGQREARDGVVLLRNAEDRSQTTIQMSELPTMFRSLKTI